MNIFTKNKFENAVNSLSRQRMTFSNILNETRSYANARYGQKPYFCLILITMPDMSI